MGLRQGEIINNDATANGALGSGSVAGFRCVITVFALTIGLLGLAAAAASAGDGPVPPPPPPEEYCKKVYGEGGDPANKGFARVCLLRFVSNSERGKATLHVARQRRESAPHPVYVRAGFTFKNRNGRAYRLGGNAPATYTETIVTSAGNPKGARILLCYDARIAREGRCFKANVLWGHMVPAS